MSLQELKEQAIALSVDERLELISALARPLRRSIALSIKDASRSETIEWAIMPSYKPINNIEKAEMPLTNQFINLNHWR